MAFVHVADCSLFIDLKSQVFLCLSLLLIPFMRLGLLYLYGLRMSSFLF